MRKTHTILMCIFEYFIKQICVFPLVFGIVALPSHTHTQLKPIETLESEDILCFVFVCGLTLRVDILFSWYCIMMYCLYLYFIDIFVVFYILCMFAKSRHQHFYSFSIFILTFHFCCFLYTFFLFFFAYHFNGLLIYEHIFYFYFAKHLRIKYDGWKFNRIFEARMVLRDIMDSLYIWRWQRK